MPKLLKLITIGTVCCWLIGLARGQVTIHRTVFEDGTLILAVANNTNVPAILVPSLGGRQCFEGAIVIAAGDDGVFEVPDLCVGTDVACVVYSADGSVLAYQGDDQDYEEMSLISSSIEYAPVGGEFCGLCYLTFPTPLGGASGGCIKRVSPLFSGSAGECERVAGQCVQKLCCDYQVQLEIKFACQECLPLVEVTDGGCGPAVISLGSSSRDAKTKTCTITYTVEVDVACGGSAEVHVRPGRFFPPLWVIVPTGPSQWGIKLTCGGCPDS